MTVIQLAGAGGGDVYILDVYLTASAGSPDLSGISVTATKGTSSFSAISDASGRAYVQITESGSYTVTASKSGYVFSPASQSVTASNEVTDVNFSCYVIPTYSATVTGVNINGRTITLTPTTGNAITLITNSSGATPSTSLMVGMSYTVTCDYPDGQYVSPVSASITASAGGVYSTAFTVLARPKVTVTVSDTSSTATLSGITVTATPTSGTAITGTTGTAGTVTLSLTHGMSYTVTCTAPSGYMVTEEASLSNVQAGQTYSSTVVINKKPTVSVTVTDASGSGYESGRIISMTDGTHVYTGTTGTDGTVTILLGNAGTFTASMTNVPADGGATFTPTTITAVAGGVYDLTCAIEFGWCYGVRITIGESDPATAVTYTDGCAGWTPMSFSGTTFSVGSWANAKVWDYIDPVAYDGSTDTLLNKTNLAQDVNGNAVSTTTDKFTRIKKMWLDIHNDGTYIYVRVADRQKDSNFSDWSFSYNGTVQECMRIGCYLAYNTSSRTYSRTSVTPTNQVSLTNFITYAQARGTGYDLFRYNQLILIQALYVIMFRNLDSQSKLGQGYTGGSAVVGTGANNALVNQYGMYGSTSSGTVHVSFLWIEDFYGNLLQWIGGMGSTSTRQLAVSDKSASSISGWETAETGVTSDTGGYLTQVVGTAKTGFCPKETGGSSSTYYCDYGYLYSSYFPYFGGYYSRGSYAGAFFLRVNYSATYASASIGSRLSHSGGL